MSDFAEWQWPPHGKHGPAHDDKFEISYNSIRVFRNETQHYCWPEIHLLVVPDQFVGATFCADHVTLKEGAVAFENKMVTVQPRTTLRAGGGVFFHYTTGTQWPSDDPKHTIGLAVCSWHTHPITNKDVALGVDLGAWEELKAFILTRSLSEDFVQECFAEIDKQCLPRKHYQPYRLDSEGCVVFV